MNNSENEVVEQSQKKLRKAFLVPSPAILDVLKIYALKKHMRYEEFYYYLIREGFKSVFGKYPEDEDKF